MPANKTANAQCGNPLFLRWIRELQEEVGRTNAGSKLVFVYRKAANSMQSYPVNLNDRPGDCIKLAHIGKHIADKITARWTEFLENGGDPSENMPKTGVSAAKSSGTCSGRADRGPAAGLDSHDRDHDIGSFVDTSANSRAASSASIRVATSSSSVPAAVCGRVELELIEPGRAETTDPQQAKTKANGYVPKHRGAAYAILMVLYQHPNGGLGKNEIIAKAAEHTDTPMRAASSDSSAYSGWSSMSTLKRKGLHALAPVAIQITDPNTTVTSSATSFSLESHSQELGLDYLLETIHPTKAKRPHDSGDDIDRLGATTAAEYQGKKQRADPASKNGSRDQPFETTSSFSDRFPAMLPTSQLGILDLLSDYRSAPIRFRGGTFDIHLVLDSREMGLKYDRDGMELALKRNGVQVCRRALVLGDVLWIARRKSHSNVPNPKDEPHDEEIVLNYIVERKTMSDLVSSIIDSRYSEQKVCFSQLSNGEPDPAFECAADWTSQPYFRLHSCCIDHVTYLIEDVNSHEAKSFGEDSIFTALASTQIQDGFFLKKTANNDDTIVYLTNMTRMIERMYLETDLVAIAPRDVYPSTVERLRRQLGSRDRIVYHLSFSSFQEINQKNARDTLRDLWIKQLLCINGVSAEKAVHIANHYPTPALLRAALVQSQQPAELLSGLGGIGRQAIGKALSKKISDVFILEQYPRADR
ncbi:ERCC4 domain-containing protein [Polychytrium aggregatum]|uniref:ERCC4 domain-containing protein n=1 Tax=Polychytrium aggregatum TaxID=110093 RepID=UPI0022FDC394|nr:ERCC4 domain-containing protein [Polychytrium aggregatum]KAI9205082.1 ERCC4 domain-containing protein [Polychytrium aggregatum]